MIYNRFNREISCHHVTVSLHHRITVSLCQSVICLAPCHQTSQSFALPPATKPVSHLPCPYHCVTVSPCHRVTASPHHRITALVSHLPCPLPPNQSVICLAPYHCVTASPCHHVTASLHHCITVPLHHHVTVSPRHCISQSFALPPATKPVSHLPCPLPPNQSVICLAPYHCVTMPLCHHVTAPLHHCITTSPRHRITTSPCHRISQSFALPPATKPVSHLPCPLPLSHRATASLHHHITAPPCHHVTTSPHHRVTV